MCCPFLEARHAEKQPAGSIKRNAVSDASQSNHPGESGVRAMVMTHFFGSIPARKLAEMPLDTLPIALAAGQVHEVDPARAGRIINLVLRVVDQPTPLELLLHHARMPRNGSLIAFW